MTMTRDSEREAYRVLREGGVAALQERYAGLADRLLAAWEESGKIKWRSVKFSVGFDSLGREKFATDHIPVTFKKYLV